MVEFASNSTSASTPDGLRHPSKLKKSEPLDSFDSKANDYSFADSFLDYDSLKDWIEELTSPVMADAETVVPEAEGKRFDLTVEGHLNQGNAPVSDPTVERSVPIVDEVEPIVVGSEPVLLARGEACDRSRDLNCIIEEGMSKVALVAGCGSLVLDGGSTVKIELECREDDGKSDVESEGTSSATTSSSSSSHDGGSKDEKDDEEENSSSSSSGDSSCDDEEEEDEFTVNGEGHGEIGDLEEGEIRDVGNEDEEATADHMVAWNGYGEDHDDEDDEEAGVEGGPISSKNELKVLPPVPRVYATLQPHHQTLPVGVVLSIMGNQVIVEGVEKHNPLNEGSILWITETGSPLGLVDEIFGPVKNPYYSVRYNSESEVPAGICGGTHVSFVPEFADYVLNNNDLYKKGYDASGMNDEEVSDEEEFSDDEKEIEFKRMQRFAKRAMNDNQKNGNRNNARKKKNSAQARKFGQCTSQNSKMPDESRKYGQPTTPQQAKIPEGSKFDQPTPQLAKMDMVQPSSNPNQHTAPPLAPFAYHAGYPNSSVAEQCFINGTGVIPSFPPTYNPCFNPTLNGIRPTEMPFQLQQQQNPFFPNTLSMNGMPWLLQNPAQQVPQMPMLNTFTGAAYPLGLVGTTSPGLPNPLTSIGAQGVHSGGLQFGQNQNLRPPLAIPGSMEATHQFNPANSHPPVAFPGNVAPQQFNTGSSSSQERKSYGRGGSSFRGRRGWRQTR